jgi:protein pelota
VRLLGQDKRLRSMKLRPDTLDDLWHLYNLIQPGDQVTATTQRTVTVDRGIDEGEEKLRKKTVTLTVLVERVEFHDFANRLRVLGTILGGEEQGRHHTLNIEPLDELTIAKPQDWKEHQVGRVQEAVRAGDRPIVVFLAIEDGEATLAVLRQYGLQEIGVVTGPGSGKRTGKEEDRGPWFGEIAASLQQHAKENGVVLVVGPGFTKDQFLAFLKDKHKPLAKRTLVDSTAHAGIVGIREAMKRGLVDRVDKEARVAIETKMVEKVLEAIAANQPSAYGRAEVKRALDLGAASLLLVTDRAVREGEAEALLALAKATQCEGHVISTGHEAGKRLDLMGGAAALLRYALGPVV